MLDLNIANVLTLGRILLVPVLAALLLSNIAHGDLLGGAVFVIASCTDALDGWIARRNKLVTNVGKLLDPLADKLLLTAAIVSLVALDRLAAWVAMVIIAREFAVTGLRLLAAEQGRVIPASIWGKLKTAVQMGTVLVVIFHGEMSKNHPFWLTTLIYLTVFVTIASGVDYFIKLRRLLNEPLPNDVFGPNAS